MVVKLYQDPVYKRQVVHSFESESHPLSRGFNSTNILLCGEIAC
jgi:hypothetical protein